MKQKGSGFPSPRSLAKIMKDCQEYSDRSFRDMNKYDNCTIEELSKLVQEKHEQGFRRETDPDAEGFSLNPSSGPASTPLHRSEYEKDLSRMKKIGIKDLQFGRNQDSYIVGELKGIPWRVSNTNSGLNILLKDHHGLVMRCSLQNIIKSENWGEFDALFPEGRKVVILHPYYTRAIDHLPLIRVERREEFYFEDEKKTTREINFDILVQQSKKLKEEGNQLLNKDINKALLKYLESILAVLKELPKFANEEKDFLLLWKVDIGDSKADVLEHLAIVLSNCSFAWKQTNKPIKAYYFAQAAIFCDPNYFKSYLRKIDALIDLLNFSEAQDTLEFVKKHKDAKQFESTITKFEYDMHVKMMLYNDSEDMMVRFLRGALKINEEQSFVGSIKSFVHPEKGRGYKARTNLKQGDVLIVERGFMNHEENPDFCIKLIDYLDKNVGLKPAYMNLYPSVAFPDKYKPENHGGQNSGFTLLKSMFDLMKYNGKKNWRNFDSEEAGQLLLKTRYNYLRVNDEKLGIFPHVSLINHSCIPNAVWLVIENTIMIYAVRDISEGEEITIDYAATSILKGDREEKLDFYDIRCQCERCKGEGKWKEMEIKISGFPCKKCGTLTMSKRNSERKCKYTCPKCSETWDLKSVQTAMVKKIEEMGTVPKDLAMGEKFLNKLEKEYGEYSLVRLQAIRWLVRESVNNFDEEKFSVYFKKLASMETVPSNFRYREILVEAMQSIGVLYDRCPDEKELGCLEKFGLPYKVMRRYWESDIEKDRMPGQALMGSTNLFGKCTCGCEK